MSDSESSTAERAERKTPVAADRVEAIDLAKGFAILSVICIHANVFAGTAFHEHVIDRAVPIFLFLFGITSELSWRKAAVSDDRFHILRWYESRFRHLLPAMWAAMFGWWLVALSMEAVKTTHPVSVFLDSFVGFAPRYGTSWFVAIIIQIVLLFPVLRWLLERLGPVLSCALAGLCSALSIWFVFQISDAGHRLFGSEGLQTPFYYQWIFAPRVFWQVVTGMAFARSALHPSRNTILICALLVALGPLACDYAKSSGSGDTAPFRETTVMYFLDVPLAIAVLGAFDQFRLPTPIHRFLAWCGASSWGLYLGHTLVFESFHLVGHAPEEGSVATRGMYAVLLFMSGMAFVTMVKAALSRSRTRTLAAE